MGKIKVTVCYYPQANEIQKFNRWSYEMSNLFTHVLVSTNRLETELRKIYQFIYL